MKKLLVWLFLLSVCSWAYADDEGADLGTIIVESSRSNDTAGAMNKDVSIITSEDIANSPAKSLSELLGTVPGVDARFNSSTKDQQVDMGQFGESSSSNVVILVDGRRLNTPDLAGPDLSLIDLNTIDHIEIIQGAGTVLYGDNATGGVINIVLKKGQENTKPAVTLSSEVDSYKGNKDGMDISGGLPKLAYQFNYDRQQTDNYRTYDNFWANDYDTHLDYNPTDIFGVDFAQGYHLDRYRLPGGLTIDDIDSGGPTSTKPAVDESTSSGSTSDSHFDLTPHMKFDAGTSNVDLSLFTSSRKSDTDITYAYESLNTIMESYEFQPKLIITTPLTDRLGNKLTTGYDYIYYKEKRQISFPDIPEDIIYASEASQSVYLLDEMTLDDRWLLNTGARGAWADYVFDETQQTPTKFDRSPTIEGYDGGLGYKYNPNSKMFVDYTRSYRLPNLDEFFQDPYDNSGVEQPEQINSGLTYQVGNQYQLGIKDQSFKGIHLGSTFTEVQYKHEIYDDPAIYANANYDGKTRHYSEEADASVDLFNNKISPFANVTFQQAEFIKGTFSGNQIPDVADQLAHAGITYRPLEGLSTSITTNFVGKRFEEGDDANTSPKVKRYDTVDWSAKYDYKNIEVWVTLKNIFGTHYFVYETYGSYYPAPTRNIAAGVKVKF